MCLYTEMCLHVFLHKCLHIKGTLALRWCEDCLTHEGVRVAAFGEGGVSLIRRHDKSPSVYVYIYHVKKNYCERSEVSVSERAEQALPD